MKLNSEQRRGMAAAALMSTLIVLPLGAAVAQTQTNPGAASGAPAARPPAPAAAANQAAPAANQAPSNQTAPAQGQQAARDPEVERRITDLHKQLKITQQQEQQFQGFADVMRSNAQVLENMAQQQQQQAKPGNAVDDLRAFQQFEQEHADGLKRLIPAFETLYQALNDQQKKTADTVLGRAAERAQQRQTHPRG